MSACNLTHSIMEGLGLMWAVEIQKKKKKLCYVKDQLKMC